MLKKVIPIAIVLCLIFSISATAENTSEVTDSAVLEESQQVPQSAEEIPQDNVNADTPSSDNAQGKAPSSMPVGEIPREGLSSGQRPQGNFTPPQNAGGFTPPQGGFNPQLNNAANNSEMATQTDGAAPAENLQFPEGNQQFGNMDSFPDNMQSFNGQTQEDAPKGFLGFVKTYSTPITSVVLLGLAFIFVIFYRKKNY